MGLAPLLVKEVFRIIGELKERGITMLLVEQFAAAALKVADYGYVLENGHISCHGPAEQLQNDPAVKAAYLGASALMCGMVIRLLRMTGAAEAGTC